MAIIQALIMKLLSQCKNGVEISICPIIAHSCLARLVEMGLMDMTGDKLRSISYNKSGFPKTSCLDVSCAIFFSLIDECRSMYRLYQGLNYTVSFVQLITVALFFYCQV